MMIRPILMYGILVGWTALKRISNLKLLEKTKRVACFSITGALRTSPTVMLKTQLHLLLINIGGKQLATSSALRMADYHQYREQRTGHAKILSIYRHLP